MYLVDPMQLICPNTKKKLQYFPDLNVYQTSDKLQRYPLIDGVIKFLETEDKFYEGAYTSTSKWLPKSEKWYHLLPLVLLNSGYVSQVRQALPQNAKVLEIGCGGGISYFGRRFEVIGLDVSFASLLNAPYRNKLQADAVKLPLEDNSVDAVVSCSFWEHIPGNIKEKMLMEFKRVLRPGGKIIFFYDVLTRNSLISRLKIRNPPLYDELFILKDGHLGYHTPVHNKDMFVKAGFKIKKHFGKERTRMLALSALQKLVEAKVIKIHPGFLKFLNQSPFVHIYYLLLYIVDNTIGRFYSEDKSRVMLTIAEK